MEKLNIDMSKFPEAIDYISCGYSVDSVDSFTDGVDTHLLCDICINFIDNCMVIIYDRKNFILCLMLMYTRLSDECIKPISVYIGDTKINYTSVVDLINNNSDLIYNNSFVKVYLSPCDFKYSKNLITYVVDPNHNSSYYLLKELDRWDSLKK